MSNPLPNAQSGSVRAEVTGISTEERLRRVAYSALIFIGFVTLVVALDLAQSILAPLVLAVIIGLVFGPLVDGIEAYGVPAWFSAMTAVLLLLTLIGVAITGFAVPLADWMDRLPVIWSRLQAELANWKGLFASLASLQDQFSEIAGGDPASMTVNVAGGDTVKQVAFFAPSLAAQIILFLAGLFFFIATRHQVRYLVLSRADHGRRRKKLASMFDDVESRLSSYMLSVFMINLLLAVVVSGAMWLLGVPSPMLWGLLAGMLNFIIYIGPAVMACIMLAVGLSLYSQFSMIVAPAAVYLFINFLEAQFVTPLALGRIMTVNPFLIFLSLVGWIWLWGPIGGFIAVPVLLIAQIVVNHSDLIGSEKSAEGSVEE
nr:AI-2E family transporter [uncultured Cohaesibacter sp.]